MIGGFIIFIFPKNYNFSYKFLGFIDYSTIFINLIYGLFLIFIFNLFINSLYIRICLFIIFFLPFFLFSLLRSNKENIFIILFFIIKFLFTQKVYLYNKISI